MEGLYENWINIGDERKISFTNLNPGKYKLKVRIADDNTSAVESEASIVLIIFPPGGQLGGSV